MKDRLDYFLVRLVEVFLDKRVDMGKYFPFEKNHPSSFCHIRPAEYFLKPSCLENADFWEQRRLHQQWQDRIVVYGRRVLSIERRHQWG